MCHPAKARQLLKSNKATVYRRNPFTIILKYNIDNKIKCSYTLKIDYGSKHTGLAILKGNKVTWLGQIEHRVGIQERMLRRKQYRKRRRSNNLRYRKPRYDNRKRKEDWFPPSLSSKINNLKTVIKKIKSILPLRKIVYENNKFDLQKIVNPEINGIEYQQGKLFGYEVRQYLLEKFDYRCVYCGKSNIPLEIEHVIPKSRGGTNRIDNLVIACHICNQKKGNKTAKEFGFPQIQEDALKNIKDAAIINLTRWAVYNMLLEFNIPIECGSGGRTKFNRTRLGFPKEHYYDAVCIGKSTPEKIIFNTENVQIIKAIGRGKHQRTNVDKFGFPRNYLQRQKNFFGFQSGDMVKAIVPCGKKAGVYQGIVLCRKTGFFDIKTIKERIGSVSYKKIQLIQKNDGYQYNLIRRK